MSRRTSKPARGRDDDGDTVYRRTGRQRIILSLGVFAVMGCLAAVAFIGWQAWKLDQIEREDVDLVSATDMEPQNWLIVGSDSRDVVAKDDPNAAVFHGAGEPGGQRSDTIMIVRFDPQENTLDILSLQRDLWLEIARTGGNERINTAYTYDDGPQRLIDTIKLNLGIDINHYAEINFASFEGIVEAVGGVPMYFDHPLLDDNSGLVITETGCQTLNGQQALAFARSRHLRYSDGVKWIEDPSGDLGRISRQQFFMRRMMDQVAKKAFSDPLVTNDLISVAQDYIKLDDDSEITKVVAMGQRMGQFEGDSIKSWTLPTTEFRTDGGAAVLKLDQAGAQPVIDRFRGIVVPDEAAAPEGDLDPATVSFAIENGSGTKGQASEAQKAFEAIGYDVTAARDHATKVSRTEVRYAPGSMQAADQVERHLSGGAELVADSTLDSGEIVVVTGADFTTISRTARERTREIPADETSGTSAPPGSVAGTTPPPDPSLTPTNDGTERVGVIPGQPPEGVVCE
jgi:polyisoprenyl-teichoic acid--peptidoglycan teichoic acid transferase